MLYGAGPSQRIGAFQHDGIVVDGVDAAAAHHHLLAAVDIDTVAVGIDGDVFYEQMVNPREEHGKMAATQETDIADAHITAVAQRQRLVGHSRFSACIVPSVTGEYVAAVDEAFALHRHVVQAFAPQQRVVPVAVAEVLIGRCLSLCLVVPFGGGDRGRFQHGAFLQPQRHARLKVE